MNVYKAVAAKNGKLKSLSPARDSWALTYEIGKTTRCLPGTPGIFVFKTLEDAKDGGQGKDAIFLCKTRCKPRLVDGLWIPNAISKAMRTLTWLEVLGAWSKAHEKYSWTYPKGTHVVESVTPIEFVG